MTARALTGAQRAVLEKMAAGMELNTVTGPSGGAWIAQPSGIHPETVRWTTWARLFRNMYIEEISKKFSITTYGITTAGRAALPGAGGREETA